MRFADVGNAVQGQCDPARSGGRVERRPQRSAGARHVATDPAGGAGGAGLSEWDSDERVFLQTKAATFRETDCRSSKGFATFVH